MTGRALRISAAFGLASAFGLVGVGGEPQKESVPIVMKTYAVVDLIGPIAEEAMVDYGTRGKGVIRADHPSVARLGKFAELLRKSIGSEGSGKTLAFFPYDMNRSLVVRGTEADHAALANRLVLLRAHQALVEDRKPEAVEELKPEAGATTKP